VLNVFERVSHIIISYFTCKDVSQSQQWAFTLKSHSRHLLKTERSNQRAKNQREQSSLQNMKSTDIPNLYLCISLHIPKPTQFHPLIHKPTPKPTQLNPLIPKPTPKPIQLHPSDLDQTPPPGSCVLL